MQHASHCIRQFGETDCNVTVLKKNVALSIKEGGQKLENVELNKETFTSCLMMETHFGDE
jgi:hypothetical protein